MTVDARRAGDALAASSEDLARVWRAGRASARPAAFPGLIDGVIDSYLLQAGDALANGRDPALVWPATEGVVRLDVRDPRRTSAELDAEWDLVEEVLLAALGALDAGEDSLEWARRAVVLARASTRTLRLGGRGGVLPVILHSDPAAMRIARAGGGFR
jgi:hypothetical protein